MATSRAFLAPPMQDREQAHRRFVLGGIGAVLILSLSPIFGHHLSSRVDAAIMGQDHVLGLCLIALHTLVGPVHTLFHVLLGAGLVYAIWDRLRAAMRIRRTLALLPVDGTVRDSLNALVQAAGVARGQVRVIRGLPNPAFTAGWLHPRIYLASSVCDALSTAELAAVLRHEAEHVRRHDPLRLSLLRFLACTLFWIPAFRRLSDDMADEAEISADDAAACEEPLALASAILALAAWKPTDASAVQLMRLAPTDIASLVVSRGGASALRFDVLLERRIRRLAGESASVTSHLTRRSLIGAALTLCLVWVTGVIVAHPMPAASGGAHAVHCEHVGRSALTHLFCLAELRAATRVRAVNGVLCPHATGRLSSVSDALSSQ